jgi:hypothetical protein
MSAQKRIRYNFVVLLILLTSLVFVLSACGGKSSITGRWEQISGKVEKSLIFKPGTLWEFFDDGTVSISEVVEGVGNISGKYSWPDSSHLKIEPSIQWIAGVVYEFARSGDEITLTDPSAQTVIVLRRYKEFSPSPQSLAGTWEIGFHHSQCFLGLGLDAPPQEVSFGTDGTFSVSAPPYEFFSLGPSTISLYGQFSVNGNRLDISATGTKTEKGLFGLGETKEEQIGGEVNCQVTVSHSRLLFRDDQGQVTLYVRAQK